MKKIIVFLFYAAISFNCFSEIRKSSNAAFFIMKSQTNTQQNPYISNGLIAMWDGDFT